MYGTNIKRIRKKKKITQQGLAKRMGVSRQAVCMWETDKREIRVSTLKKIAQIFSVRPGDILSESTINKISLKRKGESMRDTIMSLTKNKGRGEGLMKKTQPKATFTLTAPKAGKVAVTGSFNSWDKTGTPLEKDKSGAWTGGLNLKPGRYEYRFIVDGQWWTDPTNKNTVRNSFGSENSVVEIKKG
ncbi:MAG: helix-turn-helix domain-containing protein [Candidatus Omnitrophica bacterium]|nr:helix-turn-helix domain-containing protein [Candidatus Omnitrophota bacterium]